MGKSQISAILSGNIRRPPAWEVVRTIVAACAQYALQHNRRVSTPTGERWWRSEYELLVHATSKRFGPTDQQPETHLTEVEEKQHSLRTVADWNPFELGVHRAIEVEGLSGGGHQLPPLPAYAHRKHDDQLDELLASPQHTLMVVLVGGSSTGKTRAAYEAVRRNLPASPLLRPVDGPELLEMIASRRLADRSVLWLDEVQIYLDEGIGSAVAAALRRLLATGTGPVVVIATMWPHYWDMFTARPSPGNPDAYQQARELLGQMVRRIVVPEVFSPVGMLPDDLRVTAAVNAAGATRNVIQVLAGGPLLLERYEHPAGAAGRHARAVLSAAMDARRLGYRSPLTRPFLQQAAPAYLDPEDRVSTDGWFDSAMALATEEFFGIRALTAVRQQRDMGPPDGYRLADYLDQHARTRRKPIHAEVWDALVAHTADANDRAAIAWQAEKRCLRRHAFLLAAPIVAAGHYGAKNQLVHMLRMAGRYKDAEWWERCATDNDTVSDSGLSMMMLDARGQEIDDESTWRSAAATGDTYAMTDLVLTLEEAGRIKESERWLRQAAENNNIWAMDKLADRLQQSEQLEEAEVWLRRAIAAGNSPITIVTLAALLEANGRFEEAERWLRRIAEELDNYKPLVELLSRVGRAHEVEDVWRSAAETGDLTAMRRLAGLLYDSGRVKEAEYWLRTAAEAGDFLSIRRLVWTLNPSHLTDRTEQWLLTIANTGEVNAMIHLAGLLAKADRISEAEQWLRCALETGDTYGVGQLADLLEETGRVEEANRLRRFGIEPGGRTADAWRADPAWR